MKITHRIPTTQYGYVEVEDEFEVKDGEEVMPSKIRDTHDKILAAFAVRPQNTLPDKEFTDIIYGCLHNTMELTVDKWESMNAAQQNMLKCLKNALTRKKPTLSDKESN